jgi:hypothetical protein
MKAPDTTWWVTFFWIVVANIATIIATGSFSAGLAVYAALMALVTIIHSTR